MPMNQGPFAKRAETLGLMVDGVFIRAIARIAGGSINTVVRFVEHAGQAFDEYQDRTLRGLIRKWIPADEM